MRSTITKKVQKRIQLRHKIFLPICICVGWGRCDANVKLLPWHIVWLGSTMKWWIFGSASWQSITGTEFHVNTFSARSSTRNWRNIYLSKGHSKLWSLCARSGGGVMPIHFGIPIELLQSSMWNTEPFDIFFHYVKEEHETKKVRTPAPDHEEWNRETCPVPAQNNRSIVLSRVCRRIIQRRL